MFNFKFLKTYIPLGSRNTWKNLKFFEKKIGFGKKNFGSDTDTHSFGRYRISVGHYYRLTPKLQQTVLSTWLLMCSPTIKIQISGSALWLSKLSHFTVFWETGVFFEKQGVSRYRGSPLSTNSLSTIPGIVRFEIVLKIMDSPM